MRDVLGGEERAGQTDLFEDWESEKSEIRGAQVSCVSISSALCCWSFVPEGRCV